MKKVKVIDGVEYWLGDFTKTVKFDVLGLASCFVAGAAVGYFLGQFLHFLIG